MVDADAGVRSGIPPVEGFGCTSLRTDAVPSFPRASSTVTLARLGPASEYERLASGDACSRVRLPAPKSDSYETIRAVPLSGLNLADGTKETTWPIVAVV